MPILYTCDGDVFQDTSQPVPQFSNDYSIDQLPRENPGPTMKIDERKMQVLRRHYLEKNLGENPRPEILLDYYGDQEKPIFSGETLSDQPIPSGIPCKLFEQYILEQKNINENPSMNFFATVSLFENLS